MKKSYLLKGIEPELMKNFKAACAWYEFSMRDTLIKHMYNIVDDYMKDRNLHYVPKNNAKKGGKKR